MEGAEVRLRRVDRRSVCTWQLRLRKDPSEPVVSAIEVTHARQPSWKMYFAGRVVHTHHGVALHSGTTEASRLRLGAFTQHGQLFDLRDWMLVEQRGFCSGMIALKPGAWAQPDQNFITAAGAGETMELAFPRPGGRTTRTFLLVHAPAQEAVAFRRESIKHFEPAAGYPSWPARLIARHGFARPERLRRIGLTPRPTPRSRYPYGDADDLRRLLALCREHPHMAGDCAFWQGRTGDAREAMLATLRTAAHALSSGAYLHPRGNPVASRDIAPAIIMYSMLDALDKLSEEHRCEGASLIATLAELLLSRDFYPHHVATIPPGKPGSVQGIYHGMLNQNFNTDRYAAIGVAGCVLHWHRHSRRWVAHAMQQLESQLDAYLYEGGAWEESHTYANHVKVCLLPLVAAMRRIPDGRDWTTDPRFREFCRFYVQLLSPPDPLLGGSRGVPAVGDHGYRHQEHMDHFGYSYLFGWLASVMESDRECMLWAWQQTGGKWADPHHEQARVMSPIFVAPLLSTRVNAQQPPTLPERSLLKGYGAYCRRRLGEPTESLLVVRCGDAWGHYHPDQGSFWWWSNGRLLCADADLGDGTLKLRHVGHNVVGYINHEPMQYLGRPSFPVQQCVRLADGTDRIECRVPCYAWKVGPQQGQPIPPGERPEVMRRFDWKSDGDLRILDRSIRAPGGRVTWNLHVPAEAASYDPAQRRIIFHLAGSEQLILSLPTTPIDVQLNKLNVTWRLSCLYAEGELVHELHHAIR